MLVTKISPNNVLYCPVRCNWSRDLVCRRICLPFPRIMKTPSPSSSFFSLSWAVGKTHFFLEGVSIDPTAQFKMWQVGLCVFKSPNIMHVGSIPFFVRFCFLKRGIFTDFWVMAKRTFTRAQPDLTVFNLNLPPMWHQITRTPHAICEVQKILIQHYEFGKTYFVTLVFHIWSKSWGVKQRIRNLTEVTLNSHKVWWGVERYRSEAQATPERRRG